MIDWLKEGQIVIVPLIALIITQFVKVFIDWKKGAVTGLSLNAINAYGGMPSAHSALFASLMTTSWIVYGWASFEFSVSAILYFTVVRDAVGIRWHLGSHGAILKQLIKEHLKDKDHIEYGKIITRLGHTPFQATVGTMFGVVISILLNALI